MDKIHPEKLSSIPPLKKQEFKSTIPEYYLADSTEEMKYIMEKMSILTQSADWMQDVLVDINTQVRKTNGRVTNAEDELSSLNKWRDVIMSNKTLLVFLFGMLMAFGSFSVSLYSVFKQTDTTVYIEESFKDEIKKLIVTEIKNNE